jgi:hypothetical protein
MELTSILFVIACVFPLYGFIYGLIFVGKPFAKGYWYYLAAFYVYVLVLEGTVVIWSGRVSAIHWFLLFLWSWSSCAPCALNSLQRSSTAATCPPFRLESGRSAKGLWPLAPCDLTEVG